MKQTAVIPLIACLSVAVLFGAGCGSTHAPQKQSVDTNVPVVATSSAPSVTATSTKATVPDGLLPVSKTKYRRQELSGTDLSLEIPVGWRFEEVTLEDAKVWAERFQDHGDESFLSTSTHNEKTHIWKVYYVSSEKERSTGANIEEFVKIQFFVATIDRDYFNPSTKVVDESGDYQHTPINKVYRDTFGIDEGMGGVSSLWYKHRDPAYFAGDAQKYYDILYMGGGGIGSDIPILKEQLDHMKASIRRK